jgi:CHAD domain-containing protein
MSATEKIAREPGTPANEPAVLAWALALFDAAAVARRLSDKGRRLLQIAVDCYQAAGAGDADQIARRARDVALAMPIDGLTSDKQAIVAGVVALQRDKARPRREPVLLRLDADDHKTAMRLAAILQIARALGGEDAGALLAQVDDGATTLVIGGPRATELADAAAARADLWRDSIGPLTIRPAAPEETLAAVALPDHIHQPAFALAGVLPEHLDGGEPVAEGARRVLRRFFGRMLAREEAILKDDDPEDVHEMRVASRRLRAALQVVEMIYDPKQVRRYRRGLRRVAQALADVRDLDVFYEHVVDYQATLPEDSRAGIGPLLAAIEAARAKARAALLEDLKQRHYEKFKRTFAAFLTTPGDGLAGRDGIDATTRVRDFAGSALWRRYEQWRAHETVLSNPTDLDLHAARIAGKRLRYTLEFFADALGPNVETLLAPLTALQENLGALQDSVVARQHVAALDVAPNHQAAIEAYLQTREDERATHMAALPRLWEKVGSATYRRRLFELIVKL